MRNSDKYNRSGVALIELAMVLPVILGLFLGSIEFSRQLRVKLRAVALSKEVGYLAFRTCWEKVRQEAEKATTTSYTPTPDAVGRACLDEMNTASLKNQINQIADGSAVMIRIFRCTKDRTHGHGALANRPPTPSERIIVTNPDGSENYNKSVDNPNRLIVEGNAGTYFVDHPIAEGDYPLDHTEIFSDTPAGGLGDLCRDTSPIITAEAFIPYTTKYKFFPNVFNADEDLMYASTIF